MPVTSTASSLNLSISDAELNLQTLPAAMASPMLRPAVKGLPLSTRHSGKIARNADAGLPQILNHLSQRGIFATDLADTRVAHARKLYCKSLVRFHKVANFYLNGRPTPSPD
jgi:hypothetical protein